MGKSPLLFGKMIPASGKIIPAWRENSNTISHRFGLILQKLLVIVYGMEKIEKEMKRLTALIAVLSLVLILAVLFLIILVF